MKYLQVKRFLLFLIVLISSYSIGQDSTTFVNDSIYEIVDVDPEYPGGANSMTTFIHENLEYPEIQFIQDVIYIRLIFEKDGTLTNAEIVKGD
ncbi:MAG: hypothetical protein ACI8ZM_005368 [Crocinitomix sp.]|jgi:hypothetical protein